MTLPFTMTSNKICKRISLVVEVFANVKKLCACRHGVRTTPSATSLGAPLMPSHLGESVARANAQRARRVTAVAGDKNYPPALQAQSFPQSGDAHTNSPVGLYQSGLLTEDSTQTGPTNTPAPARLQFDPSTGELPAELNTNNNSGYAGPVHMNSNIEVDTAIPLVTRCNPNLVRRAPPRPATPVPTQEEVFQTPCQPLVRRAHLQAPTPPVPTLVAGFKAVAGGLQAPSAIGPASKRTIVEVSDNNNDGDNNVLEQALKRVKAVRPRASDIEDLVHRGVVIQACTNFQVALATDEAFPGVDADNMAMIAFMQACKQKGVLTKWNMCARGRGC
ncbi:hypothetical protein BC835DRAFT_1420833 [Cytidiella melzeri]|nr:hypothetical protein BC835DRAFT_1420833 [Cytidiella melzeri]